MKVRREKLNLYVTARERRHYLRASNDDEKKNCVE